MDTSVLILILIGIIIAAVVVIWRSRQTSRFDTKSRPPTFGDEPSTVELPRPVPRQPTTPPAGSIPEPQPLPADDTKKEEKPPVIEPQQNQAPPERPGAEPPPPPQTETPPTFGGGFDDETMRGIPRDMLDRMREQEEAEALPDDDEAEALPEAPSPAEDEAPLPPSPAPEPATAGAEPPEPEPVPRMEETAQPIQFSTYYPKEVAPEVWNPLVAYLFKESAADTVKANAKQQLGERIREFREVGETAGQPVQEGATVTATPTLAGFQFNPPSITVGFFEDWHRFDFKLRAKSAPLNQSVNGMMTFTVEGVIVADIPMSVFVAETVSESSGDSSTQTATAKPYDAIFCSYSRKDMAVVQRVERAYKILGLEYMRDMISIRSGEQWSEALERLIQKADIFQLFWSTTSHKSDHVAMEWKYALTLKDKPANWIRPVYWEQPMPPVPEVLGSIHFAFDPALDDEETKP